MNEFAFFMASHMTSENYSNWGVKFYLETFMSCVIVWNKHIILIKLYFYLGLGP